MLERFCDSSRFSLHPVTVEKVDWTSESTKLYDVTVMFCTCSTRPGRRFIDDHRLHRLLLKIVRKTVVSDSCILKNIANCC